MAKYDLHADIAAAYRDSDELRDLHWPVERENRTVYIGPARLTVESV